MTALLLAMLAIGGIIPPSLGPASRAVWVTPDMSSDAACQIATPERWQCDGIPERASGIVVIVGDGTLAYRCVGACEQGDSLSLRSWGRLVVIVPGGVAPEDLHGIRPTAWKPDRSAVRMQLRRFVPVADQAVDIVQLSNVAFWIAGSTSDADAFLSIDGSAIGSLRAPLTDVKEGPPELPLFVPAPMAFPLTGRVRGRAAQDVEGAEVELYEPLTKPSPDRAFESLPMVRRRQTRSDGSGSFTFERLAPGIYLIVVTDSMFGRATARVESLADPLTIQLIPPRRATGRVLRGMLPVPSARVRFLPDRDAFVGSADPRDLVAEETPTDADGRFSAALPSQLAGTLQVIAPDGASARLPLRSASQSGDIAVGDITLSEQRRLAVRLLDPASCTLSAVGPLGAIGLTVVHATESGAVHWFEIPEPGDWALDAACEGQDYAVQPMIVSVPATGADVMIPIVDVRLLK